MKAVTTATAIRQKSQTRGYFRMEAVITRSSGYLLFPDFIIASPKLEFQPIIGFDEV